MLGYETGEVLEPFAAARAMNGVTAGMLGSAPLAGHGEHVDGPATIREEASQALHVSRHSAIGQRVVAEEQYAWTGSHVSAGVRRGWVPGRPRSGPE